MGLIAQLGAESGGEAKQVRSRESGPEQALLFRGQRSWARFCLSESRLTRLVVDPLGNAPQCTFPSLTRKRLGGIESSVAFCVQVTVSFVSTNDESDLLKRSRDHELIGLKLHVYQCVSLLGAGARGKFI
jgi:hypothetical protein